MFLRVFVGFLVFDKVGVGVDLYLNMREPREVGLKIMLF